MSTAILRRDQVSENTCFKQKCLTALFTISLVAIPLFANNNPTQRLVDEGFENVTTTQKADTLFAAFENNTHRASYRAIGIALKALADEVPDVHHFKTVVLEYGKPQIAVHAQLDNGVWTTKVDYDTQTIEEATLQSTSNTTQRPQASSYGKIDVTLYPIVSIDNHLLDKLAEVVVILAPSVETSLWKGNRIFAQPIIPIFNNVGKNNPDSRVQLGVLGIRQDWLANSKWNISTTAGSFLYNVMGLHADATYHINPRLDVGLRAGISADQAFYKSGWKKGKFSNVLCMANASYYEPVTSFQIKASAGRFLYGDFGVRGDLVRHFGEYAIGVYGIYTDGERNAGFNFAIPLGKRKQYRNKLIRVRAPQYFSWEYSMISYYRYAFERMGRNYKERPEKSFTTHYWQATYLQQYLQRYLDGHIK